MSSGRLVLSDGTEYDVTSEGIIHGSTLLSALLGNTDISSVGNDITDSISNLGSDISTAQSNINTLDGEVDSLDSRLDTVEGNLTNLDASDIPYDNTTSGMTADDIQSAIDELNSNSNDDYEELNNLPSINGIELLGNTNIGLLSSDIKVSSGIVGYDNSISGLSANTVKTALDALKSAIDNIQPTGDADDITYDNTTSGLTATNVQDAIDEVASGAGSSGDYPDLTHKPSINGVELLGNKVIGLLSTNIQVDSDKIGYDNTISSLLATNVKSALDELASNLGTDDYPDLNNKPSINGVELLGNKTIGLLSTNIQVGSDKIGYNNATSGLTATNVKDALDELANGSGGTGDYPDLTNKPSINGVQLLGNKVIGLLSGNIQVGADKIGFNNTSSGLSSTNVQTALVELATDISNIPTSYDADDISYDNTSSGMVATDVQTAINELKTDIGNIPSPTATNTSYSNSTSGLVATTVQGAIDEVVSNVYTKAQIDGKVTISSTDISEGSPLATGNLYIVYTTS